MLTLYFTDEATHLFCYRSVAYRCDMAHQDPSKSGCALCTQVAWRSGCLIEDLQHGRRRFATGGRGKVLSLIHI